MTMKLPKQLFAICIHNENCDDLTLYKVYLILPDEAANQVGHVRIVDESGEDYLYPANYFVAIKLPKTVREILSTDIKPKLQLA